MPAQPTHQPPVMAIYKVAQICRSGDLWSVADEHEGLSRDTHCEDCGEPLLKRCPHCNAHLRVREIETDDGTVKWRIKNICYNCGNDLPWRPPKWKRILRKLPSGPQSPSPRGTILTEDIREALKQMKYGHEVTEHIRDGAKAYRRRQWHQALGSYIHALEWAAITYLEAQADLDIIERENEGEYYSFAKGENNLLDELQKHVELDQKTVSAIRSMNQAQRRWMAHHKTGSTLREEADAVRARLGEFLKTLFE